MEFNISKDLQNFINNIYESDGFIDVIKIAKYLDIDYI
jgi:hypothetical protein